MIEGITIAILIIIIIWLIFLNINKKKQIIILEQSIEAHGVVRDKMKSNFKDQLEMEKNKVAYLTTYNHALNRKLISINIGLKCNMENLVFYPAYENNRYGLKNCRKKKGLYFIKENGVLVYIGMTKYCIQNILYRHFQKWHEDRFKRYKRVTYEDRKDIYNYEVAMIEFEPEFIEDMERLYILKYQPRDNAKHCFVEEKDFPF